MTEKHYKPESERKRKISASILPANFAWLEEQAQASGMNNFSAALDEAVTRARLLAGVQATDEFSKKWEAKDGPK